MPVHTNKRAREARLQTLTMEIPALFVLFYSGPVFRGSFAGADGVGVGIGDNVATGVQREVQAVQGGANLDQVGEEFPSANRLSGP